MTYIYVRVITIILIYTRINGEIAYEAEFSDDFKSCKDFENKNLKCDSFKIGLVDGNEGGDGVIGLSGVLEIYRSVEEGYQVNVEVWKIMDVGKEFTFASVSDICKSLKREDAPWYPLVLSMNITDCPIPAKHYPISDLIISLEFARNFLNPVFCGEYEVILSVLDEKEELLSCYVLDICIAEFEKDN